MTLPIREVEIVPYTATLYFADGRVDHVPNVDDSIFEYMQDMLPYAQRLFFPRTDGGTIFLGRDVVRIDVVRADA